MGAQIIIPLSQSFLRLHFVFSDQLLLHSPSRELDGTHYVVHGDLELVGNPPASETQVLRLQELATVTPGYQSYFQET